MLHKSATVLAVLLLLGAWIAVPVLVLAALPPFLLWLGFSRRGRQALTIAGTGLSTLPQRPGATLVIVIGIAGVVGVLVALLAMAEGFQATLQQSGDDKTAIVLRAGSNAELNSVLDHDSVTLIRQAPGVARGADGRPLASAETVIIANIPKKSNGVDANVEVRGVGREARALRPAVRIIRGRRFQQGRHEVIVGRGALQQFAGLEPGGSILLSNQRWDVVGVFASGDAHESEVWADVDSLNAAARRNVYQSVTVRLDGPDGLDRFRAGLAGDPRLNVEAETTRSYYTKQSQQLTRLIRVMGVAVAVIMAIGAVFGALNTMYSAVAARAREIATLRALGFSNPPVVVAVLLETMLLALLGGLLGAGAAWLLFNGYTASTLGSNFSQVVFEFRVTPKLMLGGLQWALAIGFIGGLFPALQAAHVPVTVALREL